MADMGLVLTYAGPAEEALAWLRRAREVDPYFDPPWYWRQSGQAYMALGRYQEALDMFEHILLRTIRSSAYMAGCHARLGHDERAREYAAECLARSPSFSVRQFMSKEPFRNSGDAECLAESLRMAGLPGWRCYAHAGRVGLAADVHTWASFHSPWNPNHEIRFIASGPAVRLAGSPLLDHAHLLWLRERS